MSTTFKYDLFFEQSPDLLCIAGYDGYFKKINPAVSRLLGYSDEELYSRPINDFVYYEDQEITHQVREELTKAVPLFHFENRYVTKSGEIVWLSWTSHPVPSEQLIFAIAKNITHKKRLDSKKNEHLTNLAKVNNELKQLTYTTTHDLRSPVNNLLAIFSLIDINRVTDPETAKLIGILKLASEKLRNTLDGYVDVLTEKHKAPVQTETVFAGLVLTEVLKSISSLIETTNAQFRIDLSGGEKVLFNKAYLESVFLNLVTNSIKYARPGISPAIFIRTEKTKDKISLAVSDNGLGFDMEKVKDQLFGLHKRFHTTHEGKGVGLFLVYSHVTSLGGEIRVESKINEGTTFYITLPAVD